MHNYKNVYINNWFSIVGPIEKNSNLKNYDLALDDYYYEEKTFENAELKMQKITLNYLTKIGKPDIVLGTDLLDQLIITNMNLADRKLPFMGLYSACASSVGGLIMMANLIESKAIKEGIYITSSHNLTAEKQYRFPVEYGAPKPKRSTFTATGSIGLIVSKREGNIRLINGTIGNVIDSKIKDANNMGAVMAPSAVDTLVRHLKKTNTTVNDYDLILTGDLGEVGVKLFRLLLKEQNINIKNHIDAGASIYSNNEYSGASGPAVLPLYLFDNIIYNKKYHKILLLATGSLHSPLLINQKNSIPAITHALTIEVIK
jgi:stage V sporulation protein AD